MIIYEYFYRLAKGEKIDTFEFTLDLFLEIVLWSTIVYIFFLLFSHM